MAPSHPTPLPTPVLASVPVGVVAAGVGLVVTEVAPVAGARVVAVTGALVVVVVAATGAAVVVVADGGGACPWKEILATPESLASSP